MSTIIKKAGESLFNIPTKNSNIHINSINFFPSTNHQNI
jgi:hypothetical protein